MKKIKSVMIVDDNEGDIFINRNVVERLISAVRIHTFTSATDALNYLQLIENISAYHRLFAPQLILLDINMPVLDGFGFLQEFDKFNIFKRKPVDIFMISASCYPDEISKANDNKNVLGVISKPLTEEKLMAYLKKNH